MSNATHCIPWNADCTICNPLPASDEWPMLKVEYDTEKGRVNVTRAPDAPAAREELETVIAFADKYRDRWQGEDDHYWLARLMQEVGELASALVYDHPDSPDHELRQVASIAINFLRKRAARVPVEGER